jgi:hypothetical protein
VDGQNAFYSSVNGVLFDKSQSTLIAYPGGLGGSYTIPNGVTSIGNGAFEQCYSLTNVTIPNTVTSIGNWAFEECPRLTTVTLPNGVTSIGDFAFWNSGLTGITIPNTVTNIGALAFRSCELLTNFTVVGQNALYSSVNGVLFDKSQTTLVAYPGGLIGSYTIPGSVTNVGDRAFFGCNGLTSAYFLGNAPTFGSLVFFQSFMESAVPLHMTVYYLPGTTGWDSIDLGVPIVLWKPLIQAGDASFGVQNNQFGFNINWASGQKVVVEACTNLTNPVWQPVQTNILTSDSVYFSDPQWMNYPARFYRLRSP